MAKKKTQNGKTKRQGASTAGERAEALRHFLDGEPVKEIARRIGRSASLVSRWAKAEGWDDLRAQQELRIKHRLDQELTDDRAELRLLRARETAYTMWSKLHLVCFKSLEAFRPESVAGDARGLAHLLRAANESTEILTPLLFGDAQQEQTGGNTHGDIVGALRLLEGELADLEDDDQEELEQHMPPFLRKVGDI